MTAMVMQMLQMHSLRLAPKGSWNYSILFILQAICLCCWSEYLFLVYFQVLAEVFFHLAGIRIEQFLY